jgi:hypothetical protein
MNNATIIHLNTGNSAILADDRLILVTPNLKNGLIACGMTLDDCVSIEENEVKGELLFWLTAAKKLENSTCTTESFPNELPFAKDDKDDKSSTVKMAMSEISLNTGETENAPMSEEDIMSIISNVSFPGVEAKKERLKNAWLGKSSIVGETYIPLPGSTLGIEGETTAVRTIMGGSVTVETVIMRVNNVVYGEFEPLNLIDFNRSNLSVGPETNDDNFYSHISSSNYVDEESGNIPGVTSDDYIITRNDNSTYTLSLIFKSDIIAEREMSLEELNQLFKDVDEQTDNEVEVFFSTKEIPATLFGWTYYKDIQKDMFYDGNAYVIEDLLDRK